MKCSSVKRKRKKDRKKEKRAMQRSKKPKQAGHARFWVGVWGEGENHQETSYAK